jgi:hypothetical protein
VTTADGAVLRHWRQAADFGARVAVTTRHGGTSAEPYDTLNLGLHVGDEADRVIENRRRAARAFGAELTHLVFAQQVHGSRVTRVEPDDAGRGTRSEDDALGATDVLLTTSPEVVLAILVADCLPIAMVDATAGVLAVAHAGWRGTAAGAVAHALEAMVALGAEPARVAAYLGPGVAADRYQVGHQVREGLADAVAPEQLAPGVARPDGPSHCHVDLVAANRQQLVQAGLDDARVFAMPATTSHPDFFSDRAARPCGRFAVLAQLLA